MEGGRDGWRSIQRPALPRHRAIVYVFTCTYVYIRARAHVILFDGLSLNGLHMHVSAIARMRTHSIANSTRKRTQTHANKRTQRIAAIDAWAISACKRDCILRVGSKTFRMYYSYLFVVEGGGGKQGGREGGKE